MITHADRIRELEAEGCTNSEAHDVANAEASSGKLACDKCAKRTGGEQGLGDKYGLWNVCALCAAETFALAGNLR